MTNKKNLGLREIVLLGSLALTGCSPNPTINMQKEETKLNTEAQYSVKRVAVFEDDLSYNNRRGIYKIIDQKTGKTYFGVSGIGIIEVGTHQAGKSTIIDER